MSEIRTLRPGLLVALTTSITGGTYYRTTEIEADHTDETGARRARWETERIVTNAEEHAEAVKVRTKVRGTILKVCTATSAFGLLCPESNIEELRQAIRDAREIADEFNLNAEVTRIRVGVLFGRIAQDEVEAQRAMNAEIRSLMDEMEDGLKRLDANAVQKAANEAKQLESMLTDESQARSDVAITAARKARRQIVKLVKAGEDVGEEVTKAAIAQIEMARASFLDMEGGGEVQAPDQAGLAIDLSGDGEVA
jgi:hypothetical protein